MKYSFRLARSHYRSAYAALLKRFPHDTRVGVAALGRLRMDSQHAHAPAADAFRRPFAAAPNERVSAKTPLARLVEAVDAMGDKATCLAEQGRYHARYPNGAHLASVRAYCGTRQKAAHC